MAKRLWIVLLEWSPMMNPNSSQLSTWYTFTTCRTTAKSFHFLPESFWFYLVYIFSLIWLLSHSPIYTKLFFFFFLFWIYPSYCYAVRFSPEVLPIEGLCCQNFSRKFSTNNPSLLKYLHLLSCCLLHLLDAIFHSPVENISYWNAAKKFPEILLTNFYVFVYILTCFLTCLNINSSIYI